MRRVSSRFRWYAVVWLALALAAIAIRLSVYSQSSREQRGPLIIIYVAMTFVLLGVVDTYERRRLIRASGLAGSRTFGRLRGWLKTGAVEFALDGRPLPVDAQRTLRMIHRLPVVAFATWAVVVPCLLI